MLNLRQTYCDNRLPLGLQLTDDPGMNQERRLQLINRPLARCRRCKIR